MNFSLQNSWTLISAMEVYCFDVMWRVQRTWGYAVHAIRPKFILTHWGRVTHICVSKITIIGSDNGLSPGRRQAIIWINARILLIWNLGTNFNEILIEIHTFSFRKMLFKMSSAQWRRFRLGLNVFKWIFREISFVHDVTYSANGCEILHRARQHDCSTEHGIKWYIYISYLHRYVISSLVL